MGGFDYAGKVRALLATAESYEVEGNEEAASTYRNKAFQVMRDYQIAEEEALAVDPTSAVPTHIEADFKVTDWELGGYFAMIVRRIAAHTGVRVAVQPINGGYKATMVGYEGDLRYTEFLWTSAYLMFSTRISPVWDENRSMEDNIFFLRNAGIERREIADRAWGNGSGREAKNRSKVQRIYLAQAALRGEEARATGLGFNTKTYREAYAQSFVDTLTRRLRVARDAADSVGGGLVLHGRSERVDEAFYELFPTARPSTEVAPEYVPANKDCAKCAKASSGYCREHNWLKPRTWTQADEMRHRNRTEGASAQAGRASGRSAAEGVSITRDHTTASRLDRSGAAIEG